jgi:uncharacterized protein YceH (UPF0502 family)
VNVSADIVTDTPNPPDPAPPDQVVPDLVVPDLVMLDALEARVLGCLIEKAATTPDVYPLTLNAAHVACNQKTNRDPIMNADLGDVGHALRTLEEKKLVRTERGARALRYEHTIDAALNLTSRARALIALLLLRGPQTQAELLTRSERLADFPNTESLGDTLDRLIARTPALAICVGRGSGQREDRYMHLLCGPVSIEQLQVRRADAPAESGRSDLEARVEELERLVAELQRKFESGE